jgi:hypothetical protein
MTKTLYAYWLFAVLSACSMAQPKPLPDRINDEYIAVAAVANEVAAGVTLGYYSKDEARGYAASLAEAHNNLVIADGLLGQGNLPSAEVQLKLVNNAISGARAWLATKRKEARP